MLTNDDGAIPEEITATVTVTNTSDLDAGESTAVSATFTVSGSGDFVIEAQVASSDGPALGHADLD